MFYKLPAANGQANIFFKNHKTQKYTKDKKSRNFKINGNHKQVAKTGQLTNNKKVPQNLGQQVLYTA